MSLAIVQRVRASYPTPLGERHGAFLIEVARALGKGLVRKDWGTYVRVPDGTGVSQDCVMDPDGHHWDILEDGEGKAKAAWGLVEDEHGQPIILGRDRYYAVAAAPTPPAPPAEPPANTELLHALTLALGSLSSELAAVRAEVAALKARPFPHYEVEVFGQRITVKPKP